MSRPANIEAILARVVSEAEGCQDGSDIHAKRDIEFYRQGMDGTIPWEWRKHAAQVEREQDPEWPEYVRLSKKLGGGR